MVKFYETSFDYDFSFPAVTLAYFLRYPNPYAKHVLSTDVIDRHYDPDTQHLTTTRLHLKRSKIPSPVLKVLPKGILGSGADAGESYVLETSTVDVKNGWMMTETRNLEWTGILSVIEKQKYQKLPVAHSMVSAPNGALSQAASEEAGEGSTNVTTTVTLKSKFGQTRALRRQRHKAESDEETPVKQGFFSSWSSASLQRSIEGVGLRRTREALFKSRNGMNVVLDRLRRGGLVAALDGMRQDRESAGL